MPKISVIMPVYNTKPERFKIAIQLFGHLRTYKKCFPALKKHLLNKYNCDIFIHTWDTIDHNTKTWHKNKCKNAIEKVNKNEIVSLYHPKTIKIEKQISNNLGVLTANNRQISIFGLQSMFYAMKSVNDLRCRCENNENIRYDYVIFIRPDVLLHEDFCIEKFTEKYTPQELVSYVFHAGNCVTNNFDIRWINALDTLFFMKPETANNLFSNLNGFKKYLKADTFIPYGPEYFLIQSERNKDLHPVALKYFWNQHFDILRPFSWKNFRRNIISIKIKNKQLDASFFSGIAFFSFRIEISFFCFDFYFSIGRRRYK